MTVDTGTDFEARIDFGAGAAWGANSGVSWDFGSRVNLDLDLGFDLDLG